MRKLKMILTACGSPGASTFIQWMKKNGEREIEIVGVDMNPEAIGRFFCDKFRHVPAADDPSYPNKVMEVIEEEKPDVFFPASSADVLVTARMRERIEAAGAVVVASDEEPLELATDKYKMYETLRQKTDVPLPKYKLVKSLAELEEAARELGYPEKKVCFKPPVSKGSRGFRIIDDSIDRKDLLLNYKPTATYISMGEVKEIFSAGEFPTLMVMEVVEGRHYDAMVLCRRGEAPLVTVKTREKERGGIITEGELVDKPGLVEQARKILKAIPLSYNVGLQFIGDKIIEINPRVSTFIYQEDMIEPYLAVKLAMGETTIKELEKYQEKIKIGKRMIRYFDQVFYDKR